MSLRKTMLPGTHSKFMSNHKTQEGFFHEMPKHWEQGPSNGNYFLRFSHLLHGALCFVGLGYPNLHDVWEFSRPGAPPEVWKEGRDMVKDRLQHLNIMVGLIFTAMTAFCTTEAPGNSILPYTKPGPYVLLILSAGFSMGGLIVGGTAVFAIHGAKVEWFNEILMGSRFRIWVTIVAFSFPYMAAMASASTVTVGLITAAWYSEVPFIRGFIYVFFAPSVVFMVVACWMVAMKSEYQHPITGEGGTMADAV